MERAGDGGARALRPRLWRAAYAVALALVLASYLWRVSGFDLRFPTPWPDEGAFLWPAIAIQETNQLFAPQLHPDRDVLWMPPGYMVVQGLVFKATGFSLAWARSLSALYLCAAMAALAVLFAGLRTPFVHLVLIGAFLHAPIALLAGNVARMEALLLLIVCGAVLCIARGGAWPGLALLAVAPLVHPNGALFALGGAAFFLQRWIRHPEQRRIRPSQLAWIALPFVAWAAYAAYVAQHWESFLTDMAFQLRLKRLWDTSDGGAWFRLLKWEIGAPALAGLVAGAYAAWRRLPLFGVFALAAPALSIIVNARGWLYEVHLALAQMLVAVACVEGVYEAAARARGRRAPPAWVAAGAAGLLLALATNRVFAEGPLALAPVRSSTVYPEAIAGVAYFDDSDRRAVHAYLDSLPRSERELTVLFLPWSDALLFHDLEAEGLRFQQPLFHERRSEFCILHESRWFSDPVKRAIRTIAPRAGIARDELEEIHAREGTERWLAGRCKEAGAEEAPAESPQ